MARRARAGPDPALVPPGRPAAGAVGRRRRPDGAGRGRPLRPRRGGHPARVRARLRGDRWAWWPGPTPRTRRSPTPSPGTGGCPGASCWSASGRRCRARRTPTTWTGRPVRRGLRTIAAAGLAFDARGPGGPASRGGAGRPGRPRAALRPRPPRQTADPRRCRRPRRVVRPGRGARGRSRTSRRSCPDWSPRRPGTVAGRGPAAVRGRGGRGVRPGPCTRRFDGRTRKCDLPGLRRKTC